MAPDLSDTQRHLPFFKRWLKSVLSLPVVVKHVRRILELQDWFIVPTTPEQKEIVRLVKRIKREVRMALNNQEAYQIYTTVQKVAKVKGALAEVGVFKGASARLICRVKGEKKLYLFDTFDGLPPLEKIDEAHFYEGQFATDFEKVSAFFANDPNVIIGRGLFPADTGHIAKDETFSFVHLDVDLYQGTKDCLEYFYPRLATGGVILCHDYATIPGVRKAVDDFFRDKREVVLESSRSQALIVKVS
ncbi:MAG: TylF/MycF/NovP-related O-methyltransferase [Patescibacteria group bacterium]